MTGAGEPPTPGMSNRITGRRGSSESMNGWNNSRLAPMPLQSSSGGRPASPSRTETRMARPPIVTILIRSAGPARRSRFRSARPRPGPRRSSPGGSGRGASPVIDVGPGRIADRHQAAAAGFGRGVLLLAAAFGQPAGVVRPPGAVTGFGLAQPLIRIRRAFPGYLIAGLLVARRIDH